MVIWETEAAQGGFEMVHAKTLVPAVSPVMPDVGELGVVIVPGPEIFVHKPVPTAGAFAAIVAVPALTQTV